MGRLTAIQVFFADHFNIFFETLFTSSCGSSVARVDYFSVLSDDYGRRSWGDQTEVLQVLPLARIRHEANLMQSEVMKTRVRSEGYRRIEKKREYLHARKTEKKTEEQERSVDKIGCKDRVAIDSVLIVTK